MARNRRWLTSVTKEAAKAEIKMPWVRGARRAAFVAARTAQGVSKRSASA